jgi:hypothetical protein
MPFQPASNLSLWLFVVFASVMATVLGLALKRAVKWRVWAVLFVVLIALFSAAALSGVVVGSFVPFGPALMATTIVFGLVFSLSRSGMQLADSLSLAVLIGFQGFRLPLELLLHSWASTGTVPDTMTWTGQNWDVVTGVVSIAAIPFANRNRTVAMVTNTVGFVLLMNVLRVVVLSSPLPFAWQLERPLMLVAHFPYCLIVPLFVLPALVGHLLAFRRMLASSEEPIRRS